MDANKRFKEISFKKFEPNVTFNLKNKETIFEIIYFITNQTFGNNVHLEKASSNTYIHIILHVSPTNTLLLIFHIHLSFSSYSKFDSAIMSFCFKNDFSLTVSTSEISVESWIVNYQYVQIIHGSRIKSETFYWLKFRQSQTE